MSKEKQARRESMGDPGGLNVFAPNVPGAPVNTNPMNNPGITPPSTMDPSGMSQTPNGHYTNSQFPVQINGPSNQPQFIVNGQGNNSIFAYNNQMQPPAFDEAGFAQLEAGRLGKKAWELGLDADAPGTISPMGPIGRASMTAPGAFPSEMNSQSGGTLPLQGGVIEQGSEGTGTSRGDRNGGSRPA